MDKNPFSAVFRDDDWAIPLLALAVLTVGALLLYTVYQFCSWLRPKRSEPLPWLRMPLILGLIFLASLSLVAAVPPSPGSCKLLILGPGIGYVLLLSGLLSRIVQLLMRDGARHMLLQWLLVFFVNLNQVVISIAWLLRSQQCKQSLSEVLLLSLYPGVLVGVLLILAYRTARKLKVSSLFRQVVYVGLATAFSGGVAGCWLGAASLVDDSLLPSCIGYGCLITAAIVATVTLIPKENDTDTKDDYITNGEVYYDVQKEPPPKKVSQMRGAEKKLPIEPEIVIVPVVPTGGMDLPDIALNAITEKLQQQHRLKMSPDTLNHHHHIHTKIRPPRNQHRGTIDIFGNNEKHRDGEAKRERNDKDNRRPYNHRGWLY